LLKSLRKGVAHVFPAASEGLRKKGPEWIPKAVGDRNGQGPSWNAVTDPFALTDPFRPPAQC
jgi:hypothetical protein